MFVPTSERFGIFSLAIRRAASFSIVHTGLSTKAMFVFFLCIITAVFFAQRRSVVNTSLRRNRTVSLLSFRRRRSVNVVPLTIH